MGVCVLFFVFQVTSSLKHWEHGCSLTHHDSEKEKPSDPCREPSSVPDGMAGPVCALVPSGLWKRCAHFLRSLCPSPGLPPPVACPLAQGSGLPQAAQGPCTARLELLLLRCTERAIWSPLGVQVVQNCVVPGIPALLLSAFLWESGALS